jgi:colanic acid biosynthesis glycosyl transferase WcaI
MKSVIIVSQVFYPNTQSTSLLLTDLALGLKDCNTRVTVICGFPGGIKSHSVECYENFRGIDIHRVGIDVNLKHGMWQRLISYVSFLLHVAWKLAFLSLDDLIIGVSNPPFLSILFLLLSKIATCNYYFLIHDVYPEGLVAVDKLKEHSIFAKIWHRLNEISYLRSKKIVVLGRDMSRLLLNNYSIEPSQVECIPNWSLTSRDALPSFEGNKLARELKIEDKFIVQYSGNMGLWHDIESFVRAAGELKANLDIHFLFIGNGIRQKQARKLAQDLELDNIIWMDFLPREELDTSLTCSHVALISLNSGLEGIAVPCKLYGILASGRPIIAQVPEESEVAYVVKEENCGFVIPPGNTQELVQRILELARDRSLAREMGLRSFHAYKSKYTIEIITKQFRSMLGLD